MIGTSSNAASSRKAQRVKSQHLRYPSNGVILQSGREPIWKYAFNHVLVPEDPAAGSVGCLGLPPVQHTAAGDPAGHGSGRRPPGDDLTRVGTRDAGAADRPAKQGVHAVLSDNHRGRSTQAGSPGVPGMGPPGGPGPSDWVTQAGKLHDRT